MLQYQGEIITVRLQELQAHYAELFLLLERSAEEDPLTEQTGGLDQTIASRLEAVAPLLQTFRQEVAQARATAALAPELDAAIQEFEESLRAGLQIMSDRLNRRAGELTQAREQIKERLQHLKRKRQGANGYRPYLRDRKIIESEI